MAPIDPSYEELRTALEQVADAATSLVHAQAIAGDMLARLECATCDGTGWESPPIRNSASPEPGEPCRDCEMVIARG